ncbi:MAG: exo-alpha-sialidase [Bacteroidales bacterium]|nr:exo-alpha-sialidase [Bacteroidales bacterium]
MKNRNVIFLAVILFLLIGCKNKEDTTDDINHVKVYYEDGRFAGWPANHGIWIWEDEVLVGFVEARYYDDGGFHTYDQSTARDKYARSKDGGLNWSIEDAYEHGQTGWRYNNRWDKNKTETPKELKEPINFTHPDLALTFLRQTNDTGPSHFYYSYDRGKTWNGPYELPNLGTEGIATRTDYIIDGQNELMAFFTVAKNNGKEGRILCARTRDGGRNWERVAWVGPEPDGFEIMPSSVRLSDTKILTVIRKRTGNGQDKLISYMTDDNGKSWEQLDDPVSNTGNGGSPPALVKLESGKLALAYIVRKNDGDGSRVCVKFSSDEGQTWGDEIVLRQDGATSDAGYPRMVQRPDGKLVLVYYWNNALQDDAPPYRFIAATIFDPKKVE